jgi:DNA polymerase (family 10)
MEKGVRISINPDSHNKESIDYIKFGVNVARKALLTKDMCLNALTLVDFEKWVKTL